MIYIIEGVNKIGKTTFCNEFSKNMKIPILELKRPNNSRIIASTISYTILQMIKIFPNLSFILDRFYPSEFVYHNVPWKKLYDIDKKFSRYAKLIYIEIDIDTIKNRWNILKFTHKINLEMQIKRYDKFLCFTSVPIIRINSLEKINYENII